MAEPDSFRQVALDWYALSEDPDLDGALRQWGWTILPTYDLDDLLARVDDGQESAQ